MDPISALLLLGVAAVVSDTAVQAAQTDQQRRLQAQLGTPDEDEEDSTTPRDFTPVQPEYNLISMSDYAVPDSVNKRRISRKRNGSA